MTPVQAPHFEKQIRRKAVLQYLARTSTFLALSPQPVSAQLKLCQPESFASVKLFESMAWDKTNLNRPEMLGMTGIFRKWRTTTSPRGKKQSKVRSGKLWNSVVDFEQSTYAPVEREKLEDGRSDRTSAGCEMSTSAGGTFFREALWARLSAAVLIPAKTIFKTQGSVALGFAEIWRKTKTHWDPSLIQTLYGAGSGESGDPRVLGFTGLCCSPFWETCCICCIQWATHMSLPKKPSWGLKSARTHPDDHRCIGVHRAKHCFFSRNGLVWGSCYKQVDGVSHPNWQVSYQEPRSHWSTCKKRGCFSDAVAMLLIFKWSRPKDPCSPLPGRIFTPPCRGRMRHPILLSVQSVH